MTENKTLTYINVLKDLLESYNNTLHSSLKIYAPNEVTKKNEKEVFEIQYRDYLNEKAKRFKFKLDDIVRIALPVVRFKRKATHKNFSTELYIIIDVMRTNPPTYRVKDLKKHTLHPSIFYEHQLQKVRPESNTISNVLSTHPVFGGVF